MNRRGFLGRLTLALAAVAVAPVLNMLAEPETPCFRWEELYRHCDQIQLNWLRVQNEIARGLIESGRVAWRVTEKGIEIQR